ncbi:MAG TPA: class I SAM-dependent methyltransferase [Actinomycetota bacterium]|nr:class I SAM-dependent methyltransferase [Actinomycetota bacterium]
MSERSRDVLRSEFARAAATFAERTKGRFDELGVVEFADVEPGGTVAEVGAGTGNFLQLFGGTAAFSIAIDLTPAMLAEARSRFPDMGLLVADGIALPLKSRSVDLVACAQMLHHVSEPLPLLKEMRRIARGRVLVVDQVATENYEQTRFMNELEIARDPSHAVSRSPSAFRVLLRAAGLEIVKEKLSESTQRMSTWMAPGEFPPERFAAVEGFIERFGPETGMDFRREGDEWAFTRRRAMFLCERG